MNAVLVTTGAIVFIGFLIGIYRGAVRISVSLLTTLITLVIVSVATPHVTDLLVKYTPLDEMIESQIGEKIADTAVSLLDGGEEESGLSEENVRKVLGAAGVTEEKLNEYGITVEDIAQGKVSGDELAKHGISDSLLDGLKSGGKPKKELDEAEIPKDVQVESIEGAEMPKLYKDLLTVNNNDVIYEELGVDTFAQYVGKFLTQLVLKLVAFLCTFILVTIILRAIVFALDVVADLPVLGLINRIAGGAIGVICALFVIWVLFVIVTLLYTTTVGKEVYDMIQAEELTRLLYQYNPILRLATKF